MKLMFVGYLHGYGGAEKQLIMLANAMAERGNDVSIVSLAGNNPCYTVSDKVTYRDDEFCSNLKLISIMHRFFFLRDSIDVYKPNVVIHFNLQSAYLCALMRKKISHSSIYAERGDPLDKEYNGIKGALRNLVVKRIGGFIFQTRGARECFGKIKDNRCAIIPNPVIIETDAYANVTERRKVIVNVGRLHEQKDQKLLIQAFAKLKDRYREYCVDIFGDGTLKSFLNEMITSLGLDGKVSLKGTTCDVITQIRDASLFVLTSTYEGMPNALLEAMTLGIPCISTDCSPGGARDIIEDGVNGLLVPCEDVNALEKAIDFMLSHKEEAELMGKAAKEIRKYTNPRAIYDKWEFELSRFFRGIENEK